MAKSENSRQDRLAAALRENLKRRKAAARARPEEPPAQPAAAPGPEPDPSARKDD